MRVTFALGELSKVGSRVGSERDRTRVSILFLEFAEFASEWHCN